MAKVRFLGLQYPLVETAKGIMAQKSSVDQIKADLLQLLLTNPGERVMLPDFGVPLRKFIFDQSDETTLIQIKQAVIDAIEKWEPRVEIENIQVTSGNESENEDHAIYINITFFDPQNISQIESLVLQIPLSGA